MFDTAVKKYITVDPAEVTIPESHKLLLGGVAPRPIALVSTISETGINNLSPFSFFNAFGANPPTVVFSPSNRGKDGSTKDTLNNLRKIKECVIQAVTYDMVEQISLASTEYESDIDEFIKSGLTPIDSVKVKPKRVEQSPFQMECIVKQIIETGGANASGNLVICEVVLFHVSPEIMKDGIIQPDLINLVGRNSANFYTKAFGDAIFEVAKPIGKTGIGFDNIPQQILDSNILSANNLARLANCEQIPSTDEIDEFIEKNNSLEIDENLVENILKGNDYLQMASFVISLYKKYDKRFSEFKELAAKAAIEANDPITGWKILLLDFNR